MLFKQLLFAGRYGWRCKPIVAVDFRLVAPGYLAAFDELCAQAVLQPNSDHGSRQSRYACHVRGCGEAGHTVHKDHASGTLLSDYKETKTSEIALGYTVDSLRTGKPLTIGHTDACSTTSLTRCPVMVLRSLVQLDDGQCAETQFCLHNVMCVKFTPKKSSAARVSQQRMRHICTR